ncbi:MAG: hypothetical protein ACK4N5_24510, partial [Myxococcales bacterium]
MKRITEEARGRLLARRQAIERAWRIADARAGAAHEEQRRQDRDGTAGDPEALARLKEVERRELHDIE